MGLNKYGYRTFKEDYKDDGQEKLEILGVNFTPDFLNRNTIQIWDTSNYSDIVVSKWKGGTLTDRTLHEITMVNNSNSTRKLSFSRNFLLTDEETVDDAGRPNVVIGPNGTAHFYCTAILVAGSLELDLRTGSQDDRKID